MYYEVHCSIVYNALKVGTRDFPGGPVVKNPPANAGHTGSIPGPGRSHIPWSNKPVRHNY